MSETVRHYQARISAALEGCGGGGIPFDVLNQYEASWLPGRLNQSNNVYFRYFFRLLLEDMVSIFEFDGLNPDWQYNYFIYNLICRGWLAFVKAEPYGWIPQACTWGAERNVFGFPLSVIVTNGWFHPTEPPEELEYKLGENASYLHARADFSPLATIAAFYADKLSCLFSTFDNSAILSRNGFITVTDGKAQSMTIEKAVEGILNSEFIVSINGRKGATGENPISNSINLLESDVRKHYIVNNVLLDIENLIDQYHGELGFPVINRTKKERVQTMEQASLNGSIWGKSELWFDTLKADLKKFNALSGMDITVHRRKPEESREVLNGIISENTITNSDSL